MSYAPIVLFVYSRPDHTRQTLEALSANDLASSSVLYIFADGAKENASVEDVDKVKETRTIVRSKKWCNEVHVIEADVNKGLAKSVVDGVTQIVSQYGRIIVLEDDLITSKGFLRYMNNALDLYESEEKVMHISGYMFPVKAHLPTTFFYKQASCWGWATWSNRWKLLETSAGQLKDKLVKTGKINSADIDSTNQFLNQLQANIDGTLKTWGVLWHFSVFIRGGLCLHPGKSLVQNIGLDNTGTNCNKTSRFNVTLVEGVPVKKIPVVDYLPIYAYLKLFYNPPPERSHVRQLKKFARKIVPATAWEGIKKLHDKDYRESVREKERIYNLERFVEADTIFLRHPIKIVDNRSYEFMKREIFDLEIYKFRSVNEQPVIIDCGANIGLSVIYFKTNYRESEIIAFEPDEKIFQVLKHNVASFKLQGVEIIQKACWNEETTLNFYSEGADGGRTATDKDTTNVIKVETARLRSFLERKIDFLKIDIEGAESVVMKDIKDVLINVDRIFLEYHSFTSQEQKLPEILAILKNAGFRVHITTPGLTSASPFCHMRTDAGMDNQINIYGYR